MASPSDLDRIWQWNYLLPASVDKLVHKIIEDRIVSLPNAPAVCAWDGNLTYAELGQLAADLANRLVQLGVGPEANSIVPLCFTKSMWTAVAMLGVLKAGAGFALLDPQQPEQRLRNVVKQVGAKVIISSVENSGLSSRLAPESIIVCSQLFECPSSREGVSSPLMSDPSSVAYVAFTSGSTGEPRGALISHRNIASALHHQHNKMGLTTKTRFYDFSSYSFDASIGIFLTTLTAGGCICVPSEDDRRNNIIQSIVSLNANTVDLTPSVVALLSPDLVPCVQTLVLGGEALKVQDVSPWWDFVRVISFYGPCECTPTSMINYNAEKPEDVIHLGKGVGLVTWVVDPENHHSLVPLGDTGELLLEGPLVGLGYLNDSEKTASSFIEDPEWLLAGAAGRQGRHGRLYKTGDLVRYRSDGNLIFVGRKDNQVKVRGQRVELSEIEHGLREHPGVGDAVAVVQKGQANDSEWITAFVTIRDNGVAFEGSSSLRRWQRRLIGESMFINDRHCALPRRDFSIREFMYNTSDNDIKQIGGWLNSIISPTTKKDPWASRLPSSWSSSEFALLSLRPATSANVGTTLAPDTAAIGFISKIIDATAALQKAVNVVKVDPSELGQQDPILSSGLVVLNSVVHFFPSQAYLFNVVREALRLEGVKTVVFGGIRSSVLCRESLVESAVRLFGERISQQDLRQLVEIDPCESELLVNPSFFTSLPARLPGEIGHVEIIPDETSSGRTLSPFRYTVVIHISSEGTQAQIQHLDPGQWIDFAGQGLLEKSLLKLLETGSGSGLIPVTNIPYNRVVNGQRIIQLLQHTGQQEESTTNPSDLISHTRSAQDGGSLSVNDLVVLANRTGHRVEVSWALQSSQRGALTAVFFKADVPNDGRPRAMFQFPTETFQKTSIGMLCSQPKQPDRNESIEAELVELLRTKLSPYMIPRVIKVLDRMPLNSSCKIDRKSLQRDTQKKKKRQSTTMLEDNNKLSQSQTQVCQIWANALGIEPTMIGRSDRFFDIGGDSITAMKVTLEARKLGLAMTVGDVFSLEVHDMAKRISSQSG